MNKKCLLFASLACSIVVLTDAFPSPKQVIQASWSKIYSCGKTGCGQIWSHKMAVFTAGMVVAGGVIVYQSEQVRQFIKELLGLEAAKPVKYVIPSRSVKKNENDLVLLELGKTSINPDFQDSKACPCENEKKESDRDLCGQEECPCQEACSCEENSE